MDICTFDPAAIGTGHLFPPAVRDAGWVAYHGTSAHHSPEIERQGLRCIKPLSPPQFQFLERLAHDLRIDFTAVAHFRDYETISFSPLSELALSFTAPQKLGGQGLGYVRRLLDSIVRHPQFNPAGHAEQLGPIQATIAAIRLGTPVVYAVNLREQQGICYDVPTHAIHAVLPISQERIVAKIVVADFADYERINQQQLLAAIDNLYWRPDSTHFIKRL